MKNRCLYCYEPLREGEGVDYHAKCCRKLFGMSQAPVLPYTSNEVRALADEVVRSQTTVTGVQPKLSPLEVLWNRSQKKKTSKFCKYRNLNKLRYCSFISNWLFRVCIEYRNTLKRLC